MSLDGIKVVENETSILTFLRRRSWIRAHLVRLLYLDKELRVFGF